MKKFKPLLFILFLILLSGITIYLSIREKKEYKREDIFIPEGDVIPKLLHLIWIGEKQRPKQMSSWTDNFQKANPDWTVKVWGNKDIEDFNLVNKKFYDEHHQYCGKADIARYEILYRNGGVYIDADTVWLGNPISPQFLKKSITLFLEANHKFLIANTFIASKKGNPFLKAVIDELPYRNLKQMAWLGSGPALITDVYNTLNEEQKNDINLIDVNLVLCPNIWHGISKRNYDELLIECKENSKAFALHYGLSTNNLE